MYIKILICKNARKEIHLQITYAYMYIFLFVYIYTFLLKIFRRHPVPRLTVPRPVVTTRRKFSTHLGFLRPLGGRGFPLGFKKEHVGRPWGFHTPPDAA